MFWFDDELFDFQQTLIDNINETQIYFIFDRVGMLDNKKSRTFGRDSIGLQIVSGLFQLPHKINTG